jgi:hypothetical protein
MRYSDIVDISDPFAEDDSVEDIFGDILGAVAPLVGTVAGGPVGGLIGSALGGLAGGAGAAPAAQGAAQLTAPGLGAVGTEGILAGVRNLLSTIPPPVRAQIREVVSEMRGQRATQENVGRQVVDRVGTEFEPVIRRIIAGLTQAQTQTQATHEHRNIVQSEERWRQNQERQGRILSKLDALERRLGGRTAVVSGPTYDILGGGGMFE